MARIKDPAGNLQERHIKHAASVVQVLRAEDAGASKLWARGSLNSCAAPGAYRNGARSRHQQPCLPVLLILANGCVHATGSDEECMNCDEIEEHSVGIPTFVFPLLGGAFILVVLVVASLGSSQMQEFRERLAQAIFQKCLEYWKARRARASSVAPVDEDCERGPDADAQNKILGEEEPIKVCDKDNHDPHQLSSAMAAALDVAVNAHQDDHADTLSMSLTPPAAGCNPALGGCFPALKVDSREPEEEAGEHGTVDACETQDACGQESPKQVPEVPQDADHRRTIEELPGMSTPVENAIGIDLLGDAECVLAAAEELPLASQTVSCESSNMPTAVQPSGVEEDEQLVGASIEAPALEAAVANEPVVEPLAKERDAESIVKEPTAESEAKEPVAESEAKELVADSEARNPVAESKADEPVAESMVQKPTANTAVAEELATASHAPAQESATECMSVSGHAQPGEDLDEIEESRMKRPTVLPALKMPPRISSGGSASAYAMRRYGSSQQSKASRGSGIGGRSPSPEASLVEGQPLVDGGTVVLWKGSRSSTDKGRSVTPR